MASAAAVATDISRSPLPSGEQNDELGTTGFIGSKEDAQDAMQSSGDESDINTDNRRNKPRKATPRDFESEDESDLFNDTRRRGGSVNGRSQSNNQNASQSSEDDAGLFGSDEDDEDGKPQNRPNRLLDDEELDSGDDEDRLDRLEDDVEEETKQEEVYLDVQLGRHPVPEPSDGELYLLKVPKFLAIDPYAFHPTTWKPPVTDHHSKTVPSSTFSPYHTALSTIRWRRCPSDPSKLQSNARFLRWSDGSVTLQLATNPKTQYLISANALAPPQSNPPKPTPTSLRNTDERRGASSTAYDIEKDTFTYLMASQESSELIRITNKVTAGLKVQPPADGADDALEQLQNSLAEKFKDHGGIGVINITEDPELAKKKAEVAEREKMKAQKRREAQELRNRERVNGLGGARGRFMGGLTVGGLEGDEEGARYGGRSSGFGARKSKPRRQNRRGEIYSDEEEEFGRRVKTKEDEYDEEDDFVAKSDEEEEILDDDDDDEDGLGDFETPPPKARQRQETPKRDRDQNDDDDSAPRVALEGSPTARSKRRRVIEDDEDE